MGIINGLIKKSLKPTLIKENSVDEYLLTIPTKGFVVGLLYLPLETSLSEKSQVVVLKLQNKQE